MSPAPSGPPDETHALLLQARALASTATDLAVRARNAHRLAKQTDRKAAMYLNMLGRHAARLLATTSGHGVPVLRVRGPGSSVTYHLLRHDEQEALIRFTTVGSDGRLRLCYLDKATQTRRWVEYDAADAPGDLPVESLLSALGELLVTLDEAVAAAEAAASGRADALERTMSQVDAARTGDARARRALAAGTATGPAGAVGGAAALPPAPRAGGVAPVGGRPAVGRPTVGRPPVPARAPLAARAVVAPGAPATTTPAQVASTPATPSPVTTAPVTPTPEAPAPATPATPATPAAPAPSTVSAPTASTPSGSSAPEPAPSGEHTPAATPAAAPAPPVATDGGADGGTDGETVGGTDDRDARARRFRFSRLDRAI
jgi:hypothetical protein